MLPQLPLGHPMSTIRHILVAIRAREDVAISMNRAVQLARSTGARVTVLLTCWDATADQHEHFPQEQRQSIASRLRALELDALSAALVEYRRHCPQLEAQVAWGRHHEAAVAAFAAECGADLVVVPGHRQSALERLALPATLRLAGLINTPLLVASPRDWPERPNLLLLLDLADADHQPLNRRLVAVAGGLARQLRGRLDVASVYPLPQAGLATAVDVNRYRRAAEHDYRGRLAALAADSGQDVHRCHVEGGAIERVADRLAASCAADLVVVGTSARGNQPLHRGQHGRDAVDTHRRARSAYGGPARTRRSHPARLTPGAEPEASETTDWTDPAPS